MRPDYQTALARSRRSETSETQVIAALTIDPPAELVTRFDWVQWLEPAGDALIPNLWSKGMAVASGEIVAITIGHFVPASDWLEQIRQAHRRLDSAGIGGPIDPPRGGSAVDWATYFLRYSNYFKYEHEQTVTDIAGRQCFLQDARPSRRIGSRSAQDSGNRSFTGLCSPPAEPHSVCSRDSG